MSTSLKMVSFLVGLGAVFAVAVLAGKLVAPIDDTPAEASPGHTDHGGGHEGGHDEKAAAPTPAGLSVSQDGYTLRLADPTTAASERATLAFTVEGPDGAPVTAYDVAHEKLLHLIVVRRDQTGFQHVHPVLAPDGTWRTTVTLSPGPWRVFADFKPTDGEPLVLGADLDVAGAYSPQPEAEADRRKDTLSDGLAVELVGDLAAGKDSMLTLRVTRHGAPVKDLEPYLGAYGHLVTLRDCDLAYLHVHPDGEVGKVPPGPEVAFHTSAPSAGRYYLYFDFQHDGVVRTASFTVTTKGFAQKFAQKAEGGDDDHHDGSGGHQH